jgi:hypothetical protein
MDGDMTEPKDDVRAGVARFPRAQYPLSTEGLNQAWREVRARGDAALPRLLLDFLNSGPGVRLLLARMFTLTPEQQELVDGTTDDDLVEVASPLRQKLGKRTRIYVPDLPGTKPCRSVAP